MEYLLYLQYIHVGRHVPDLYARIVYSVACLPVLPYLPFSAGGVVSDISIDVVSRQLGPVLAFIICPTMRLRSLHYAIDG